MQIAENRIFFFNLSLGLEYSNLANLKNLENLDNFLEKIGKIE